MSKAAWIRIALLVGAIGLLEIACRIGWVPPTIASQSCGVLIVPRPIRSVM